mgnify:FL=1
MPNDCIEYGCLPDDVGYCIRCRFHTSSHCFQHRGLMQKRGVDASRKLSQLKHFLVFAGRCHESSGGWHDHLGDADTLDAARAMGRKYDMESGGDDIWWHIVEMPGLKIVLYDHEDPGTPSTERALKSRLGTHD